MRSILVHADRQAGTRARIDTALAIARQTGGGLTVLIDTPVAQYLAMDTMGGSYVISEALDTARDADDEAARAIEAQLRGGGVPFDILRCEDNLVTSLSHAARFADMVVVSRSGGVAGDLALATRAPVLALPDDHPLSIPVHHAAIAWDGSEHAAAALRAALPLLAACHTVSLLSVTRDADAALPADALRYLERHGIAARYEVRETGESIEATLLDLVRETGAQMLVMGAYGRNRVREMLFGGVTDHVLGADTCPALLLAH